MIFHAEVSETGILTAQVPQSFVGKKVLVQIWEELPLAKSNWAGICTILKEADELGCSQRNYEEILSTLKNLRETQ